MDPEAILDLADRAARTVRRRFQLDWTAEDWEDAKQEAAAGIVRALRDGRADAHEGYYFRAGQQGAVRSAFRQYSLRASSLTWPDGTERQDGMEIEAPGRGWAGGPLTDADIPALRAVLSRVPRKAGARGGPKTRDQIAVARDLIILEALSQGCTRSEIGARLGIRKRDVDGYIGQLRRRLAAIAAAAAAERT